MAHHSFTADVIEIIRSIPKGKVTTYGRVAAMAGNPKAARQVSRILHSCSQKENLPWWRVVNRAGCIALQTEWGQAEQEELLENEGIEFGLSERIDLSKYLWVSD